MAQIRIYLTYTLIFIAYLGSLGMLGSSPINQQLEPSRSEPYGPSYTHGKNGHFFALETHLPLVLLTGLGVWSLMSDHLSICLVPGHPASRETGPRRHAAQFWKALLLLYAMSLSGFLCPWRVKTGVSLRN